MVHRFNDKFGLDELISCVAYASSVLIYSHSKDFVHERVDRMLPKLRW
jgi:hypothetical protein